MNDYVFPPLRFLAQVMNCRNALQTIFQTTSVNPNSQIENPKSDARRT